MEWCGISQYPIALDARASAVNDPQALLDHKTQLSYITVEIGKGSVVLGGRRLGVGGVVVRVSLCGVAVGGCVTGVSVNMYPETMEKLIKRNKK